MKEQLPRILVVEDNEFQAKVLDFNLRGAGFDTTVASDGFEAWMHAQLSRFDLVITDYNMPDLGGTDLCRLLRDHPWYAKTPIFIVTAHDRDLNSERLIEELKLAALIHKPFDQGKLIASIKEHLTQAGAPEPVEG